MFLPALGPYSIGHRMRAAFGPLLYYDVTLRPSPEPTYIYVDTRKPQDSSDDKKSKSVIAASQAHAAQPAAAGVDSGGVCTCAEVRTKVL